MTPNVKMSKHFNINACYYKWYYKKRYIFATVTCVTLLILVMQDVLNQDPIHGIIVQHHSISHQNQDVPTFQHNHMIGKLEHIRNKSN